MRFIRKLFFFILTALLLWLGITVYNRLTDGFSVYQISSSLPPCPQYTVEASAEQKAHLKQLLNQKFYYLGKGCQFYAFESEDGKYVIKFLKHKHLRLFSGLRSLPLPSTLKQLCEAKIEKRVKRVERLFTSCLLAYQKLPEETGLAFIHLNRVPALESKVTLVDKLGCKHTLEIDDFEFFIQKKGTPLIEVFQSCDPQEIPIKIQQLADLVSARCQKAIRDSDPAFVQNVAFADGKPIFIDFGRFLEDPALAQIEGQQLDLEKRFYNLRIFMEQHFPNHIPRQPGD